MLRVFLGDDSNSDRFISGGRYLLVNKTAVIDVKTLNVYKFEVNTYERVKALNNYSAYNSQIISCSPDGTQLVHIGERSNPDNRMTHQYALVIIDFLKDTAYALPFDRTDTRFFSIWDGSPEWVNTYFEWKKDDAGKERLVYRKGTKPTNWKGRYRYDHFTGKVAQYNLIPAKSSLLEVFFDFLKNHYTVTDVRRQESPENHTRTIRMKVNETELLIYFQEDEQSLSLSGNADGIIETFGKNFDAEMANGLHQEHFGRFP